VRNNALQWWRRCRALVTRISVVARGTVADAILFLRLRDALFHEERRIEERYFPITLRTLGSLVEEDIDAYLQHEGKEKHTDWFGFIEKLANVRKELISQVLKFGFVSLLMNIYIATYVYDVDIEVPISGLKLDREPTILAFVLLIGAYLGVVSATATMHSQVLRHALIAAIRNLSDGQIHGLLSSAFINQDIGTAYHSRSNPALLLYSSMPSFNIVSALIGLAALCVVGGFFVYLNFKALWLVYEAASPRYALNLFLVAITLCLGSYSIVVFATTFIPLPYKDWSTNHKGEIIEQLRPQDKQEFYEQIYSRSWSIERAIRKVTRRLVGRFKHGNRSEA
jgi:hypothetical protein